MEKMKQFSDEKIKDMILTASEQGDYNLLKSIMNNLTEEDRKNLLLPIARAGAFGGHYTIVHYAATGGGLDDIINDRLTILYAVESGDLDVVDYLIGVCSVDIFKMNLFEQLCQSSISKKHNKVLKYLLCYSIECGEVVQYKQTVEKSLIVHAIEHDNLEVVKILCDNFNISIEYSLLETASKNEEIFSRLADLYLEQRRHLTKGFNSQSMN